MAKAGRNEAVEPRLAGVEAGQVETRRLSRFDYSWNRVHLLSIFAAVS
jgi:hypothetical protein